MSMKKKIIFSLLAAAALTACSSDDATTGIDTQVAALTFEDSDVEIRLASAKSPSVSVTRASIESDENGLLEVDNIGVFLLGWQRMNVNPEETYPFTWQPGPVDAEGTPNFAIKLDNEETNAVKDGDVTRLNWANNAVYYYPVGQWYHYRFYGYFPRQTGANLISTTTQRKAIITIDGTQDVIWGRDTMTTVEDHEGGYTVPTYAYSTKFFRVSEENSQHLPVIAFKHLLTRLTFSVVAGPDAWGSTEEAKKMRVKKITLLNIPTVGTLTIADKENANNEGKIVFDWDDEDNLANLPLLAAGDRDFSNDDPSELPAVKDVEEKVGQGILIPVPDVNHQLYIRVQMTDEDGTAFEEVEYPFHLQKSDADFQLEANYSYNVRLRVYGPKRITVGATLKPWDETNENTTFNEREIN